MTQTLILGCGYTGRRIAEALSRRGDAVTAVVRTQESAQALQQAGIAAVAADLDDLAIPALPTAKARVFYLAPPPASGTSDPRLARFLAACTANGLPQRILYFSTTGVYGDCTGEWVDEDRPPRPMADRAQRRWDAEQQLQAWREKTGGGLIVFRVAGIYGPGRLPLERLRKGLPLVRESEAPFTNRIHIEDLVAAAVAAMDRAPDHSLYNLSDGHPSTMNDYFNRVADLTGLPRPPVVAMAEADEALSAGMLSYMRESRRLSNRRILEQLGLALRYPNLAEGLPACLGEGR